MPSYINPYEIFLKVVELKNITKAAEALNYTQSGISHAIASLDEKAVSTTTRIFIEHVIHSGELDYSEL